MENWKIVTKESFQYEIIKVERIQCQGLQMYVQSTGQAGLTFNGDNYYHVRHLLTITPQMLDERLNIQNLPWFIAKNPLDEAFDRLALV